MPREATFENALAFAADLIRIPGLSGQEEDVARRVREEMEALGLKDIRVDSAGNVIGVAKGRGEAPPALLNSHLDVVAEGDHDEWEVPPFSGEVRNGQLHGRGAMDIKGPLALQTYAAASMMGEAPGDVIVAHTVFEERGGLGMKRLLESGEVAPGVPKWKWPSVAWPAMPVHPTGRTTLWIWSVMSWPRSVTSAASRPPTPCSGARP